MSCEKITYLIDKEEFQKLSFFERLRVRMHQLICKCCTNYEGDSKALSRLLKRMADNTEPKVLSDTEKEQIRKKVNSIQ